MERKKNANNPRAQLATTFKKKGALVMQCACQGKGLSVVLCDFHARVFQARNNRLVAAAKGIRSSMNRTGVPIVLINELDAALAESGAESVESPVAKYYFLLRRAYDALIWCSGAEDFQEPRGKARKGWKKLGPLMNELRELFKVT